MASPQKGRLHASGLSAVRLSEYFLQNARLNEDKQLRLGLNIICIFK